MRVDALDKPGGDLFQIQKYIEAGASRCGEARYEGVILPDPNADLRDFDLVHLTNIDRPIDTYGAFLKAKAAGKPIILSPIHHSYAEIQRYERFGRRGLSAHITGLLSFNSFEYLRSLVRCMKYPLLLPTWGRVAPWNITHKQREILEGSQRILVLSEKEKKDILSEIAQVSPTKFLLLRNGIGPVESNPKATVRDIDVCVVGRIEARKNQIAILAALNNLGLAGVFVGAENSHHGDFVRSFTSLIMNSSSSYLGPRSHSETLQLMARSKVHVSASWFEVSSLVDLESHASGCMVVASASGGTREILGERAYYVDPGSIPSIERGIEEMLARANLPKPANRHDLISDVELISWETIGNELYHLYRTLLSPLPK